MLFNDFRGIVMGGESMPIGNEEQTFELVLAVPPSFSAHRGNAPNAGRQWDAYPTKLDQ